MLKKFKNTGCTEINCKWILYELRKCNVPLGADGQVKP